MMVSSGGAASQTPLNQGESGANAQVMSRSQQQQVQQAPTDSQKTSGANTPSKDGANTPTYREQVQQNSSSQIFNLTSMRLQGLHQQQQNQQPQLARMQSAT